MSGQGLAPVVALRAPDHALRARWVLDPLGATGGAVAAGAIVGGTSGALAGAFSKAGYSKEEAEYLGSTVERGGVLVAVDTDDMSTERLRSELTRLGGRTYSADRSTGTVDVRPNV